MSFGPIAKIVHDGIIHELKREKTVEDPPPPRLERTSEMDWRRFAFEFLFTLTAPGLQLFRMASSCGGETATQGLCGGKPTVTASHPELLPQHIHDHLQQLIATLPPSTCGKVKRIEFLSDEEHDRTLFDDQRDVVIIDGGDGAIGRELSAQGYWHLVPDRRKLLGYDRNEQVIYIHERVLYHSEQQYPKQRSIDYEVLLGFGLAVGTEKTVSFVIDEVLSEDQKLFAEAFGLLDKSQEEFAHLFAHYVLNGHVMREFIRRSPDIQKALEEVENSDLRRFGSYIDQMVKTYEVLKGSQRNDKEVNIFHGREYNTGEEWASLAQGDVNVFVARLKEGRLSFPPGTPQQYQDVAQSHAPHAKGAFLFANNREVESIDFGIRIHADTFEALEGRNFRQYHHYITVAQDEAEIHYAALFGWLEGALGRYHHSHSQVAWNLLNLFLQHFEEREYRSLDDPVDLDSPTTQKSVRGEAGKLVISLLQGNEHVGGESRIVSPPGYLDLFFGEDINSSQRWLLLPNIQSAHAVCQRIGDVRCLEVMREACSRDARLCEPPDFSPDR